MGQSHGEMNERKRVCGCSPGLSPTTAPPSPAPAPYSCSAREMDIGAAAAETTGPVRRPAASASALQTCSSSSAVWRVRARGGRRASAGGPEGDETKRRRRRRRRRRRPLPSLSLLPREAEMETTIWSDPKWFISASVPLTGPYPPWPDPFTT